MRELVRLRSRAARVRAFHPLELWTRALTGQVVLGGHLVHGDPLARLRVVGLRA